MAYTQQQKSFINAARERISDNPFDRLNDSTRSVLERKNFVFDAHCHLFHSGCINAKYLVTRMIAGVPETLKPKLWKIITGKTMSEAMRIVSKEELIEGIYASPELTIDSDDADLLIESMSENLNTVENETKLAGSTRATSLGVAEFLKRYRYILQLLRSEKMKDVYTEFNHRYGVHNAVNTLYDTDYELITVALGMDLNMGWEGNIKLTQREQNEELKQLAQSYPVLPFLPVDPRRADFNSPAGEPSLYETFLEAFDSNPSFFGVKCYPSLGYLPSDSRLKPIFQICEEKNIPVMTHCGGEFVSTYAKPIEVNRDGVIEHVNLPTRSARARFLNEPREWEGVLSNFPNLKLCFGHFGSGSAWSDPNGIRGKRVEVILNMMKRFRVYGDFSYNLESSKATDRFIEKLTEQNENGEVMRSRTLYGTDFWVVLPFSNLNLDQQSFIQKLGTFKDNLLRNNVLDYLGLSQP